MTDIFPYLIAGLAGYLIGVCVNFIIEWFYVHREAYSIEEVSQIKAAGWMKYLVWPFIIRKSRSWQNARILIVEMFFVVAAPWLWMFPPERVEFWWGILVLAYFTIVIVMDVEYRIVMHQISAAGAVLGLVVGIYLWGAAKSLLGGVFGYVVMFLFYKFGEVFVRWVNKRRGEELDEVALGFGDVNLSGVVGLFLGFPPIILGLFIAIFGGGLVSILFVVGSVIFRRFRAFAAMPYAPFLALAALVMLFFPNEVAALLGEGENAARLLQFPFL